MSVRIVIITGEASGDLLAGDLITALRQEYPDCIIEGISGPRMREAGCKSWGDFEQLAVMGLFEVLRHLPRLWRLQMQLRKRLLSDPPDLLIGVDAPDFNLPFEKFARKAGIPTVHYVCPSVWAWRSSRVKTIRAACDLVLCLLPFEKSFLDQHGVAARFVGHPLAGEIAEPPDRQLARRSLDVGGGELVALLPGSRMGEARYLGPEFIAAASWLVAERPEVRFLIPAASGEIRSYMAGLVNEAGLAQQITIVDGRARDVLAASNAVLLASGTATLETMLVRRPMVVSYKVSALTAWVLRRSGMVTVDRFSLPNLLADDAIVPEILQEDATGPNLGAAVLRLLDNDRERESMLARFDDLAGALRLPSGAEGVAGIKSILTNE